MVMEMADENMEPIGQRNRRDAVVAMFRVLQAKCGIASAPGSNTPNINSDNPNYLFRTFGYNKLPTHRSEEGLVCLLINKNIREIRNSIPTFTELLHKDIIKSDKLSIFVDSMNELRRDQTQMIVYVVESNPVRGVQRRWTSNVLKGAFENPECRAALSNLRVIDLVEVVEPNERQIEQYLANIPPGVDAKSWELAKADNPDPSRMVPVQFIGFESLDRRLDFQSEFQERQKARLASMIDEIDLLGKRHDLARIRLDQFTINQRQFAHRILRVMGVYERCRLSGTEKKPYETALDSALVDLLAEIDGLSKGRLGEVQDMVNKSTARSPVSSEASEINLENLPHIRELFEEHQKGFAALVDILNGDLKVIEKLGQDVRGAINEKDSR